jgi:biotin transport system substrate-specific component
MTTFVDSVRPENKARKLIFDLLCVIGGSLFMALMAQVSFYFWFTPVPITLQTLGVMLLGALLGSRRGPLAVLLYLGEGALGFPVFAGGSAGVGVFLGPTGGYLLGFVASAFLIGFFAERSGKQSYWQTCVALAIGSAITLLLGAFWLSVFVGWQNAWAMGVAPFLVGTIVKIFVATAIIPSGWKALNLFK